MNVVLLRTLKRGPLSSDEIEAIKRYVEKGLSGYHIGLRLNRHQSTINHAIARLSLRAPRPRTFNFLRNGKPVVSFSPSEDTFIKVLRTQGYPIATIADVAGKRFGHPRSPSTILTRLRQLAALDDAMEADHG